jgi:hypothetical protein
MPKSFHVLSVSGKIRRTKKARAKKISLEEDGISGDQGLKASGQTKLDAFPAKKLTYKTAHFLFIRIFPAALL